MNRLPEASIATPFTRPRLADAAGMFAGKPPPAAVLIVYVWLSPGSTIRRARKKVPDAVINHSSPWAQSIVH
jgi:hypothetical protein